MNEKSELLDSLAALQRAAKAARKLSIQMGTPFAVWQDGKIVDLNAKVKKNARVKKNVKVKKTRTRKKG